MKKILALVIACVMVIALGTTVMAAGSGSITVKNATKGYTYTAYKILDATYQGTGDTAKVSYTTKTPALFVDKTVDGTTIPCPFAVSTNKDANNNYSVQLAVKTPASGSNPAVYYSDEDVVAWITASLSSFGTGITGTADATNSTVTFSNLDYGYYYITSGLGATVTIDTAKPTATVYDKNTTTPVDPVKKIVSVDGTAVDNLAAADAHVDSVVGFKVTASTNNWVDQDNIRTSWSMEDTPTNMTIDLSTVVVKFNGTTLTRGTNYTATVDSAGKLSINVPMTDSDGNSIYPANLGGTDPGPGLIPIEITYSAKITKEAAGTPAKNQIPGSYVEVFTYGVRIAKVDQSEQPLAGAKFELWSTKGVANGTAAALTFIDNGDGTYTYSETGTVTTLDMTTNTTISVLGLDSKWSYTLKETAVPAGYNQADDKSIAGTDLTKVVATTNTAPDATENGLNTVTVINNQGATLPQTGGIGTTIFYIVGGLLVAGAFVLLVTKRRMSVKN